MQAKVRKFGGQLPSAKDLQQLARDAPGLFDSGYFVLAAVEGAPAVQREQATFTINLAAGGTAGQIVVVPKHPPATRPRARSAIGLHRMADSFAARTHTQVAVGGPAGNLADFTSATPRGCRGWFSRSRPGGRAAAHARAAVGPRPIVAVALNLLVVGATFGVLALLFGGTDPLARRPGYIDAMSIIAIFSPLRSLDRL